MAEEKLGRHSLKQDHSECRHQPILVEEVRTCLLVSERPIGKFVSSFFWGVRDVNRWEIVSGCASNFGKATTLSNSAARISGL